MIFRRLILCSCVLFLPACNVQPPEQTEASHEPMAAQESSGNSEVSSFSSSVVTSSTPQIRNDLTIPILVYHHIRDTSPWPKSTWSYKMSVSPEVFDTHMQWLQDHGYTTISMDTLVDILERKIPGPEKPVVITFDDNQRSAYEKGFPILQKYDLTATFYLVANRLDNESFIVREEVLELRDAGMDIQSHTLSHAGLTKLSTTQIDEQLRESKRILEELTEQTVSHVSYPLTMHSTRVRERTKAAGYRTGTIMDPRPATMESNPYKLPRIMMTDDTNLERVLP